MDGLNKGECREKAIEFFTIAYEEFKNESAKARIIKIFKVNIGANKAMLETYEKDQQNQIAQYAKNPQEWGKRNIESNAKLIASYKKTIREFQTRLANFQ